MQRAPQHANEEARERRDGKKGLEGCSMGASLGGKGYDSGGVGCDGDICGGVSAIS